jgi:hypothetical protein
MRYSASITSALLMVNLAIVPSVAAQDGAKTDVPKERAANQTGASLQSLLQNQSAQPTTPDTNSRPARMIRQPDGHYCSQNGLVHADVGKEIEKQVKASIKTLEKGARLRDIAKLTLPCGFTLYYKFGGNLILTDGKEYRRYLENNPFGLCRHSVLGVRTTRLTT